MKLICSLHLKKMVEISIPKYVPVGAVDCTILIEGFKKNLGGGHAPRPPSFQGCLLFVTATPVCGRMVSVCLWTMPHSCEYCHKQYASKAKLMQVGVCLCVGWVGGVCVWGGGWGRLGGDHELQLLPEHWLCHHHATSSTAARPSSCRWVCVGEWCLCVCGPYHTAVSTATSSMPAKPSSCRWVGMCVRVYVCVYECVGSVCVLGLCVCL